MLEITRIRRFVTLTAAAVLAATAMACAASSDLPNDAAEADVQAAEAAITKGEQPGTCTVPDKTVVKPIRSEYYEAAKMLQPTCRWDPCHCYIDGLETTCSMVAACLRAGFCVLVRQ